MKEIMQKYEREIWEAFKEGSAERFLAVVEPSAVMVCGNYRCLGSEYAQYIGAGGVDSYEFLAFEVTVSDEKLVAVHYVVRVISADADLCGTFHVCSIWKKTGERYMLVFNMDSRIPE